MRSAIFVALLLGLAGLSLAFELPAASVRQEGPVSRNIMKRFDHLQNERNPRTWMTAVLEEVRTSLKSDWLSDSVRSARSFLRGNTHSEKAKAALEGEHREWPYIMPDKYFRFIPEYVTTLAPGATSQAWEAPCFRRASGFAKFSEGDGDLLDIVFNVTDASSSLCEDYYLLATVEGFHILSTFRHGMHSVRWELHGATAAEKKWVAAHGVHVFRFMDDMSELLEDVFDSVELFLPALTGKPSVPAECEARNVQFLRDYRNYSLPERTGVKDINLDKSLIHSGDALGIIRMDGLDPMLAWAMGSGTGHMATFLWIEGELYVVESTAKSNYWPKDNIQRHKYEDWLVLAREAGYNAVVMPLSEESRAKFNETAAVEWFENVAEGLPYGYHNMLWCWLDTEEDNFPGPLSSQALEVLAAVVDRYFPALGMRMWNEAFNKRIGTSGLNTTALLLQLDTMGMSFSKMFTIPEQDDWIYSDGYSMVCDVFVCEIYKNAGLFGDLADQVQCTEFQNRDVYSLSFFDTDYVRPEVCQQTDPDLPVCQIMGNHRMNIEGYNTQAPYAHMNEKCPGSPQTHYARPGGC